MPVACLGALSVDDLEAVFKSPPDSAKPGVWWHWMGCNVTKAGITRDLEEFKKSGIGMATIFGMADVCSPWAAHIENSPSDGLIAFTDPWWEMVRHAAAEGKRLGIDVGLHNCPGYTSTGGPWITPELAMQQIFQSETRVEGGAVFDGLLPRPKVDPRGDMLFPMVNKQTGVLEKPIIAGRTNYWRDIAVLAVPAEGIIAKDKVVDLTAKMDAAGRLAWTPPPGKWIIYRFGHTTMGALTQPNQWETMGLECDKMSESAVTFHLQHVIGELKKHLGPLVGTGLQHILLDSYEAGKPSWTPLMPQEFAQRCGYELKEFLPTFAKRVVGSESETKKFRSDFDRTIADLYRDKLFATMSRMLAEANLRFVCEPYGGPFNTAEVTPYVHRVMTEFWSGDRFSGGVSDGLFNAGNGKRHNILEAEAFTGGPDRSQWTETPAWLKPVGDGAFCAGINRLVLHTCPLQPWGEDIRPGMTMGQWGTHFGRTQTWWDMGSSWLAYLGRCQALLQWGGRAAGRFAAEGLAVKSIHRTNSDAHVFFIAHAGSGGQALCTFAVDGMQPELWDPVRGTMRNLTDFRQDEDETTVPLEFAPAQSWFVVFRKKAVQPKEQRANFLELKSATEIAGPWEVRFDPKWGGPEAATFDQLDDWTKRPEHGIRYYSGTATYRKTFDGSSGSHLDLGQVKCIARVRLNDRDLGVVWTAPWGVSVPPGLLRERGNVLEIEVANVWANRLIGDEQEPPDCEWRPGHMGHGGYLKRFPDWFVKNQPRPSKGRYCFTSWNYFTKDSLLTSSGLLGPVRLMSEDWTRPASPPAAKPADGIKRKTSSASPTAFESDVLNAGLVARGSITEERAAHLGGGKDASALFNGTMKNGSGGDTTQDDGKTFRGYGAGSVLTIQLTGPHDLTEIRTFAGHADERASQDYTVLVAHAATPKKFDRLATATLRCDGGASELRVKTEAKGVVALRFEFRNGPLGFNVYREIQLVGKLADKQPATILVADPPSAAHATFAPSPGWSLTNSPPVPSPAAPASKQPADPKDFPEAKMGFQIAPGPFQPTWNSIKQNYPGVPDWFRQAKFGVFVHWGPQASGKSGDWYARNLYRPGHRAYENHLKNFGHPSEFGYKDVLNAWKAPKWDAAALTKSFHDAGMRFMMVVGVHHDNFDLWDSKYQPWNAVNIGPKQDMIGGWSREARKLGMKFCITFHHEYSWWWWADAYKSDQSGPKAGVPYDGNLTLADGKGKWWEGFDPRLLYNLNLGEYTDGAGHGVTEIAFGHKGVFQDHQAYAQWYAERWALRIMDAIDKYDPDMFYTDGNSSEPFSGDHSGSGFKCDAARRVVAHFYNRSLAKHGQVDTLALIKFQQGNPAVGMTYEVNIPNKLMTNQAWIGENPVGDWYYAPGYTYEAVNLVRSLVEYISRGGNYACAVPVDPEGGLEPKCVAMLKDVGNWMRVNSEGVYGSRAWEVWGEGKVVMPNGALGPAQVKTAYTASDIRFTAKDGAVYAWLMAWPEEGQVLVRSLAEGAGKITGVNLLGSQFKLDWKQTPEGLVVKLPAEKPCRFAYGLEIAGEGLKAVPFQAKSRP